MNVDYRGGEMFVPYQDYSDRNNIDIFDLKTLWNMKRSSQQSRILAFV